MVGKNSAPMLKTIKFLIIAVAVTIIVVAVGLVHSKQSKLEAALGIKLPASVQYVQLHYDFLPESKCIELWAVMKIDLRDANDVVGRLGMNLEKSFFTMPPPKITASWWRHFSQEDVELITNKWLKINSNSRPACMGAIWVEGQLYVYKLGIYGPNKL